MDTLFTMLLERENVMKYKKRYFLNDSESHDQSQMQFKRSKNLLSELEFMRINAEKDKL